ncbi:MAG: metal ABC transporter ATP-binding protein [Deltaproteobacteria bacterium]|nr:metal ABC transporter ATP-binding protein [Deltaproteobacteria bacterium]
MIAHASEPAPIVEMRNASFGYGRKRILKDMDLRITRGDFVGLVGPNGVGKTTLARAILGILRPQAGDVVYPEGRPPRFGYVPQRKNLDPLFPLTTRDIVLMARPGAGPFGRVGASDRARADEALESVGLAAHAGAMFRDLSGGLQQRALTARALAADPEFLILDEPTAGLDLLSSHAVLDLIGSLHAAGTFTVMLISHALDEVAAAVRSLILMEAHGRMEIGPRAQVLTAEKLGRLYGVPVKVEEALGRAVVVPDHGAAKR